MKKLIPRLPTPTLLHSCNDVDIEDDPFAADDHPNQQIEFPQEEKVTVTPHGETGGTTPYKETWPHVRHLILVS